LKQEGRRRRKREGGQLELARSGNLLWMWRSKNEKIAEKILTGRLHLSLGQGLDGDESSRKRSCVRFSLLSTVNKRGRLVCDVSIRVVVRV